MKPERLEEIHKATEAASPGPWTTFETCTSCNMIHLHDEQCGDSVWATDADRELARLARSAIPELLALVDSLQEHVADLMADKLLAGVEVRREQYAGLKSEIGSALLEAEVKRLRTELETARADERERCAAKVRDVAKRWLGRGAAAFAEVEGEILGLSREEIAKRVLTAAARD